MMREAIWFFSVSFMSPAFRITCPLDVSPEDTLLAEGTCSDLTYCAAAGDVAAGLFCQSRRSNSIHLACGDERNNV
jgi:hypothetical protein